MKKCDLSGKQRTVLGCMHQQCFMWSSCEVDPCFFRVNLRCNVQRGGSLCCIQTSVAVGQRVLDTSSLVSFQSDASSLMDILSWDQLKHALICRKKDKERCQLLTGFPCVSLMLISLSAPKVAELITTCHKGPLLFSRWGVKQWPTLWWPMWILPESRQDLQEAGV